MACPKNQPSQNNADDDRRRPIPIMKEKLTEILSGFSMRWEVLSEAPLSIRIYYPSDAAFKSTLSLKRGGPAMTQDGETLRKEAHSMRAAILAAFPGTRIGFDIESLQ